jgi:hypothetical protein
MIQCTAIFEPFTGLKTKWVFIPGLCHNYLSLGETGLRPKILKLLVLKKYPDSRTQAFDSGTGPEKYFFSALSRVYLHAPE